MTTLILPVAGKSSRFPGMRPKWLLTLPDGKLMFEKAVSELNLKNIKKIVIVCIKEHIDKYIPVASIEKILLKYKKTINVVIIDKHTSSASETVYLGIQKANIKGSIFVKDCDNFFTYEPKNGNLIGVYNINKMNLIDAKNKSYVSFNKAGIVNNIVEKEVISNMFCVGGYGFRDANIFCYHYLKLRKIQKREIYISHIIYKMILDGDTFLVDEVKNYIDLGTKSEYLAYQGSFVTVFCDVDGVLLENGSKFGKIGWLTNPIKENLEILKKLSESEKLFLIITTSRPSSELSYLKKIFKEHKVVVKKYIFNLPHCQRVIINDYSQSLPYPSSLSINLERNSKSLEYLLGSLLKLN